MRYNLLSFERRSVGRIYGRRRELGSKRAAERQLQRRREKRDRERVMHSPPGKRHGGFKSLRLKTKTVGRRDEGKE